MDKSIKKNIQSVYEKYAQAFDEKIASLDIYNDSYEFLLSKIRHGSTVLDMACGPGNVSHYLKKLNPALSVTGIDISETMIKIAKKRVPDGVFFVQDICKTDFKNKFDCIVCAFVIPYLNATEISDLISNIARTLNKGGYFYLSFMEGEKEGFEKTSFSGDELLFMKYVPRESIIGRLKQHGLPEVKIFEIDYPEKDGTTTTEVVIIGTK